MGELQKARRITWGAQIQGSDASSIINSTRIQLSAFDHRLDPDVRSSKSKENNTR